MIDFLKRGKGLYIEGTTYCYNNVGSDLFNMFGINYLGPGTDDTNNLSTLNGQNGSIVAGKNYDYLPNSLTNYWVSEFSSNGGEIFFKCDKDKGRGVTCEGDSGNYRSIHSSVLFGAIRDETKRNALMKIYMNYLQKITPIQNKQHIVFNDNRFLFSSWQGKRSVLFKLTHPSRVKLDLYTITGRRIARIIDDKFCEGTHQIYVMTKLSNGMYVMKYETENYKKNNLIKITK